MMLIDDYEWKESQTRPVKNNVSFWRNITTVFLFYRNAMYFYSIFDYFVVAALNGSISLLALELFLYRCQVDRDLITTPIATQRDSRINTGLPIHHKNKHTTKLKRTTKDVRHRNWFIIIFTAQVQYLLTVTLTVQRSTKRTFLNKEAQKTIRIWFLLLLVLLLHFKESNYDKFISSIDHRRSCSLVFLAGG